MLLGIHSDNWFWLVLSVLTTWRMTSLAVYEAGPFDIFERLRQLLRLVGMARLSECFHCMAVWLSGFVVLTVYQASWSCAVLYLGVAGGVSMIERYLTGIAPGSANPAEERDDE